MAISWQHCQTSLTAPSKSYRYQITPWCATRLLCVGCVWILTCSKRTFLLMHPPVHLPSTWLEHLLWKFILSSWNVSKAGQLICFRKAICWNLSKLNIFCRPGHKMSLYKHFIWHTGHHDDYGTDQTYHHRNVNTTEYTAQTNHVSST